MSDELRDQIARAIRCHFFLHRNDETIEDRWLDAADAVLPLVEAEVERRTADLTAEIARLAEVERERDAWENAAADAALERRALKALIDSAEARVAELEAALSELVAWVGQIGYPYDFTTEPPIPDEFVRPLAEWLWHDSGENGDVDDWEAGIADEARVHLRAALGGG